MIYTESLGEVTFFAEKSDYETSIDLVVQGEKQPYERLRFILARIPLKDFKKLQDCVNSIDTSGVR